MKIRTQMKNIFILALLVFVNLSAIAQSNRAAQGSEMKVLVYDSPQRTSPIKEVQDGTKKLYIRAYLMKSVLNSNQDLDPKYTVVLVNGNFDPASNPTFQDWFYGKEYETSGFSTFNDYANGKEYIDAEIDLMDETNSTLLRYEIQKIREERLSETKLNVMVYAGECCFKAVAYDTLKMSFGSKYLAMMIEYNSPKTSSEDKLGDAKLNQISLDMLRKNMKGTFTKVAFDEGWEYFKGRAKISRIAFCKDEKGCYLVNFTLYETKKPSGFSGVPDSFGGAVPAMVDCSVGD